jgi:hypothetical protein
MQRRSNKIVDKSTKTLKDQHKCPTRGQLLVLDVCPSETFAGASSSGADPSSMVFLKLAKPSL